MQGARLLGHPVSCLQGSCAGPIEKFLLQLQVSRAPSSSAFSPSHLPREGELILVLPDPLTPDLCPECSPVVLEITCSVTSFLSTLQSLVLEGSRRSVEEHGLGVLVSSLWNQLCDCG